MKLTCQLIHQDDGSWRAIHEGGELGRLEALAASRQAVIDKLKGEIRYCLELCPCSGETYQHIDLNVIEKP